MLELDANTGALRWDFRGLPARPMERHELDANRLDAARLETSVMEIVSNAPPDAVISVRVSGDPTDAHWRVISSAYLRSRVPSTMNLDITPVSGLVRRMPVAQKPPAPSIQHALFGD